MDDRESAREAIALTRRLFASAPTVAVLVIAPFTDHREFLEATTAGASGCLVAQEDEPSIRRAVMRASRGQTAFGPTACRRFMRHMRPDDPPSLPFVDPHLTLAELRIGGMIVEGLTTHEIAQRLSMTKRAVRDHFNSGLEKCNEREQRLTAIANNLRESPRRYVGTSSKGRLSSGRSDRRGSRRRRDAADGYVGAALRTAEGTSLPT
jgi:DNA-binding NarL/FixJ family response regulator